MTSLRRALALAALAAPLLVMSPAAAAPAADPEQPARPAQVAVDGAAAPLGIAKSWVIADMDSGAVLASFRPDDQRRPASTLKLLTALTVAPRLSPDQPYRAVKADEAVVGNRMPLYAGMKYKLSDLMHGALLPSGNDAAHALAHANGGMERTVDQMQAEAERLGTTGTTVRNASGLDAEGQLTTARDLATIGRAAFANPEIASYLALKKVNFPGRLNGDRDGRRVNYTVWNHNQSLQRGYAGALGGKSGFTSGARNTYVGAAERDGHRLIVAMLGIHGNTYRTSERLLSWGFRNYEALSPVGQLPNPQGAAPTFDRTVRALPPKGEIPSGELLSRNTSDAPTGPDRPFRLTLPTADWLPSPLTLLTLLFAVLALLRGRLFWREHRARTGWTSLDEWAGNAVPGAADVHPHGRPAEARENLSVHS